MQRGSACGGGLYAGTRSALGSVATGFSPADAGVKTEGILCQARRNFAGAWRKTLRFRTDGFGLAGSPPGLIYALASSSGNPGAVSVDNASGQCHGST